MNFNPYSIDHAPAALPVWETILDDLGRPHPKRIAKVLGIGTSTVYRWNKAGQAPKTACLALFWLTRWGRSAVDAQAVNDCRVAIGYANCLQHQVQQLQTQIEHVLALNASGASNDAIEAPGRSRRPPNGPRRLT